LFLTYTEVGKQNKKSVKSAPTKHASSKEYDKTNWQAASNLVLGSWQP
jgi:hypothetical protein